MFYNMKTSTNVCRDCFCVYITSILERRLHGVLLQQLKSSSWLRLCTVRWLCFSDFSGSRMAFGGEKKGLRSVLSFCLIKLCSHKTNGLMNNILPNHLCLDGAFGDFVRTFAVLLTWFLRFLLMT